MDSMSPKLQNAATKKRPGRYIVEDYMLRREAEAAAAGRRSRRQAKISSRRPLGAVLSSQLHQDVAEDLVSLLQEACTSVDPRLSFMVGVCKVAVSCAVAVSIEAELEKSDLWGPDSAFSGDCCI